MATFRSFLAELKRRRVIRVGGIYMVAAFAALQGAQVVVESLRLPAAMMTFLTLLAVVAFPIVIAVAWAFDVTPEGVRRAPAPTMSQGSLPYVGLGILIALVGFGAYAGLGRRSGDRPAEESATSIAVLPFVNMSSDREQEYFSDGLTEELLNTLAQVPALKVAARTSSFSFKNKNVPVSEIGRVLGVRTVLEGSVRKAGTRVRITAQLVNAVDGYHLWSQTFDRELTDIFAIQEEISRSITQALEVTLGSKASDALAAHATQNFDAYNLYLQARFFLNMRTAESLERAGELLDRAVALDPAFARAHAALADAYQLINQYGDSPTADLLERSRLSARRALQLDSTLAEPHATLGSLAWNRLDWRESLAEFRQALRLNPNYATAHQWYAWALAFTNQSDEALGEIRKAIELDPLSLIINVNYGELLVLMRRYDEGIAQLRHVLELDSSFPLATSDLAWAYALKGNLAEAVEFAERSLAMPGQRSGYDLASAGYALARAGKTERARSLLPEMQRRSLRGALAYLYMGLREDTLAMDALEQGAAIGDESALMAICYDAAFDRLRNTPRFKQLVRRVRGS